MSVPRIAVSGVRRQWQGAERTGVNAAYVDSVTAAGAVPVILPPTIAPDHAVHALEGIDGVLLSGGEDIDPMWYGVDPAAQLAAVDPARDRFEFALFTAARERGLPVLGICRGLQLVNVAMGGVLLVYGLMHDPNNPVSIQIAQGARKGEVVRLLPEVTQVLLEEDWRRLHVVELRENWRRMQRGEAPERIGPLE